MLGCIKSLDFLFLAYTKSVELVDYCENEKHCYNRPACYTEETN